ncbi:MAG TPA: DUF4440 domain-containing protein [Acidobacteriaceae bacterium]|jgi:hypothetical protein|nr:DUF4440 domain-containing protein [Acidobacteriaceae bacterium]
MTDDLEAHLIELELRLQASSIRKNEAAVAEILSKDFREFGASGRVWDRASIIAELSVDAQSQITSNHFQCERLSSEIALLTYAASTPERKTLRSSLWRLENGSWRLVFHQGTVIPTA